MTSSDLRSLLLFLSLLSGTAALRSSPSTFSQSPFLPVWNAPTASCYSKHGVDLNLGTFSIVHNHNETFMGENITIFYQAKLGLYPSYSGQAGPINGGVPQNASLDQHLSAARHNLTTLIPDEDFDGLAVLDWESWRPVWERNWDSKQVYWRASEELVRAEHRDWDPQRVAAAAKADFEGAARRFMEETLKLAQKHRPSGLWGFYGFPNCYNFYKERVTNYTGECPAVEMKRNEQLQWLWNVSSALFPDIYLDLKLRGLDKEVFLYAHHRLREALRVGALLGPEAPPVFPYSRIVYTYTLEFLSQARRRRHRRECVFSFSAGQNDALFSFLQEHLVHTIGESAALGVAGIVLWGDHFFSNSKVR